MTWEGQLPVAKALGENQPRILGAPTAGLRINESNNGGIRIVGTIDLEVEFRCRRCLKEQRRERAVAVDVRLEPGVDAWDEAPGVYSLDGRLESVDVWPALREELILSLPGFPVCRADCAGLCGSCGKDLNEGVLRLRGFGVRSALGCTSLDGASG